MVDNLGFTLTPDSMVSFRDATFPMLIMSFLAYAGNTLYPCVLRLIVGAMYKLAPERSPIREPLSFLLRYPRRCYTLLFRSKPTWILFGIIFALNFIDVLLIVVLDLGNPAVNDLPGGSRVVAAIFQSASARHTGTASFNLADVNPAVQLSLLVMMYISIFPIAISVRASNIYEERTVGVYETVHDLDENSGTRYVLAHMQNQLTFDLWYIFLGIFILCISESERIMNPDDPVDSLHHASNDSRLTYMIGLRSVRHIFRSRLRIVSFPLVLYQEYWRRTKYTTAEMSASASAIPARQHPSADSSTSSARSSSAS